ncbi:hypothetical protein NL676_008633 [Syzygium grande]|nr:hypothetical protein NL676_008633 [Syzygium grande]
MSGSQLLAPSLLSPPHATPASPTPSPSPLPPPPLIDPTSTFYFIGDDPLTASYGLAIAIEALVSLKIALGEKEVAWRRLLRLGAAHRSRW